MEKTFALIEVIEGWPSLLFTGTQYECVKAGIRIVREIEGSLEDVEKVMTDDKCYWYNAECAVFVREIPSKNGGV